MSKPCKLNKHVLKCGLHYYVEGVSASLYGFVDRWVYSRVSQDIVGAVSNELRKTLVGPWDRSRSDAVIR